jgi:hypothetical protein
MSFQKSGAKKGAKAQQARTAELFKKYDKRDPFNLDDDRAKQEQNLLDATGLDYRSQVGKGLTGRWAADNPDDEERRYLARVVEGQGGAMGGGAGNGKYGLITTPAEKAIAWEKRDDDKILHQRANYALSNLVSSVDSFQRARVYERFPHLQKIPQQYFEEVVADQMRLYYIMQQGEIKSEDDNMFILKIVHIDYVIPEEPIWDPFGKISAKVSELKPKWESGREHGRFHPRNLGINTDAFGRLAADQGKFFRQLRYKVYIIKELYPAIREIANDKDQFNAIAKLIYGWSSLTQSPQTYDEALPYGNIQAYTSQPLANAIAQEPTSVTRDALAQAIAALKE